jgi:GAF domain-containing protein
LDHQAQLAWIDTQLSDPAPGALVLQRIMTFLHAQNPKYHWIGVYRLAGAELTLGPYAGPTTDHVRIPVGRGVCGTAVAEGRDQVVDDVSTHGNYLACNLETKSEMVALIYNERAEIIAQLDVDGTELAMFDPTEQRFVRQIADRLSGIIERLDQHPN